MSAFQLQLEKLAESLARLDAAAGGDGKPGKIRAAFQAADRHLDDAAFGQLMADRNARQDRDPESRHQSFFDRFRAAELHGDVQ